MIYPHFFGDLKGRLIFEAAPSLPQFVAPSGTSRHRRHDELPGGKSVILLIFAVTLWQKRHQVNDDNGFEIVVAQVVATCRCLGARPDVNADIALLENMRHHSIIPRGLGFAPARNASVSPLFRLRAPFAVFARINFTVERASPISAGDFDLIF